MDTSRAVGCERLDIIKFGRESLDMGREFLDMGRKCLNTDFREHCPDFRDQILVCLDFRSPRRDSCPDFPELMSRQSFQTQTLGATMQFGSKSECGAILGATHVQTLRVAPHPDLDPNCIVALRVSKVWTWVAPWAAKIWTYQKMVAIVWTWVAKVWTWVERVWTQTFKTHVQTYATKFWYVQTFAAHGATHVHTFQILSPEFRELWSRRFVVQDMMRKKVHWKSCQSKNSKTHQPRWRRINSWLRRIRIGLENCAVSAMVWKVKPSPPWSWKWH